MGTRLIANWAMEESGLSTFFNRNIRIIFNIFWCARLVLKLEPKRGSEEWRETQGKFAGARKEFILATLPTTP